MSIFKHKLSAAESAAITTKLMTIAAGMIRSGKSLEAIQEFLVQTVAVTTKLSNHDINELVNATMEVVFNSTPMTGVIPEKDEDFVDPRQKRAATKVLGGNTYTDVTPETHAFSEKAPAWKKKSEPSQISDSMEPDTSASNVNSEG